MRSLDAVGFVQLACVGLAVLVASCGNKQPSYADVFADAGAPPPADASSGPDSSLVGDSPGPCTNLQCQQVDCASNLPDTTVSGIVYDPAGKNPLYDVIVYVPNAPVQPFPSGATCDQCGVLPSGSPLVATLTGPDGQVRPRRTCPTGGNIPLVLQLGKWRKQLAIP